MKLNWYLIICSFLMFSVNAQNTSGIIEYSRETDVIGIMTKLPYMTQEEIDRRKLTWGNFKRGGQNYQLHFNANNSLYAQKEEASEQGYSRKKEKFLLIRDYKNTKCEDQVDFLGKTYLIKEEMNKPKWKILNEIKEIEGYLCMKAETIDTVAENVVHAWFTDAIPVSGGPEGYFGLPGMILELTVNKTDVVVRATKIELKGSKVDLPKPKKIKGKSISREELNSKTKKFIADRIEARRNPYWELRL